MGLTRLRAEQISDIDYKQAVRVVSVDEVILTGGAPNQVDGVNLSVNDRILVVGQDSAKEENGLYYVTVVGTGSNGTWVRTNDGNQTGEIQAGMIVMVTEGLAYADTQWVLTTNDPIVIGVTELTFIRNVLNVYFTSISAGGNVLTASGNSSVVNFAEGTGVSISSNVVSNTITFTATATGSNISNGNSNVSVDSSNGNVTVGVAGTANIANFTSSNIFVTANILPVSNVTYSLGSTDNRFKDLWIANSSIYLGDVTIAATGSSLTVNGTDVLTGNAGSAFSTTGNVTGGNVLTDGVISATGNITGNYFIGNGSQLTGIQSNPIDPILAAMLFETDTKDSVETLTNKTITGLKETNVALAAEDIDLLLGNWFTKTISTTTTFTVSNTAASGTVNSFILNLTNGGSDTVNWWLGVAWAGGIPPTLTAAGRDVLQFFTYDGGTTWTGIVLALDVK